MRNRILGFFFFFKVKRRPGIVTGIKLAHMQEVLGSIRKRKKKYLRGSGDVVGSKMLPTFPLLPSSLKGFLDGPD